MISGLSTERVWAEIHDWRVGPWASLPKRRIASSSVDSEVARILSKPPSPSMTSHLLCLSSSPFLSAPPLFSRLPLHLSPPCPFLSVSSPNKPTRPLKGTGRSSALLISCSASRTSGDGRAAPKWTSWIPLGGGFSPEKILRLISGATSGPICQFIDAPRTFLHSLDPRVKLVKNFLI